MSCHTLTTVANSQKWFIIPFPVQCMLVLTMQTDFFMEAAQGKAVFVECYSDKHFTICHLAAILFHS